MNRSIMTCFAAMLVASAASAQPVFTPSKAIPPDEASLKQIVEKTSALRAALNELPKETKPDVRADVEVYLKAAEWIVRHGEFFAKDSPKQTLTVLDAGLARANAAKDGKTPWRDVRGKPIVRGYYSEVDGSVQPFSVLLPEGYPGTKKWRLDVVLHGRDQTLTEVKFINSREVSKGGSKTDHVVLEPYGRGNNAYRWSGEADVFESQGAFLLDKTTGSSRPIDGAQVVLRGFSMGGAGTWQIGLHRPFDFSAIQPGAGFTTTRGYIKNLPPQLPDYQERCLHIYDAVDYAENAVNVPIVAYSGEIDPQKAAADNIEAMVKDLKPTPKFVHIVAPGLEHKQPPEWFAKCDAELAKNLPRPDPTHVRLVTYTPRYGDAGWINIRALERTYEKAIVEGVWSKSGPVITTTNIRALAVSKSKLLGMFDGPKEEREASVVTIDGQQLKSTKYLELFVKENGRWAPSVVTSLDDFGAKMGKWAKLQGPIDDAFMSEFVVVGTGADGWAKAAHQRFAAEWDKFLRGKLPEQSAEKLAPQPQGNLVLFGTPWTNPAIAKVLPKLPITWTKDKLVVNGVEYDAKTHVPVLIYPNPLNPLYYVVINSGHTFHADAFNGTNALLYPRLGDWAVLKPKPTKDDPAAAEVVAAGLFDEKWQFAKATNAAIVDLPTFAAAGAKIEKLWGDGEFTEGPTPGPDGAIYFSDIGNRILKYDPKTGKTSVFRDPSGRSNGLKFDAKGRLTAAEGANTGGNRRISVTEADGTVKTLADKFDGKKFNSPNDLTIDAKGRVYFTDPRYVGTEPRELDHESVYRVDPDGTVTRVISDVTKPNGIAISPDGKTLYLAENNGDPKKGPRQLLAYPLKDDGTVGAKKIVYDFGDDRGIDGMAITATGVIVATAGKGPTAGIHFIEPSGKKVGFLPTPETPSNCCFAGPGSKTLYITAGKSLYRIELTNSW